MGGVRRRGFTLVELTVVIAVVGLLALAAAPRLFDRGGFEARGFHDRALATVRHAQKVAIAQRRSVHVNVSASGIQACYDAGCSVPVTDPVAGGTLAVAVPAGVSLSPVPLSFLFDPLGRPSAGVSFSVVGDVTRTIQVEPETGYVHS
jgi:MSHA pilin protein MshC